ncbi:LOW QUALITY PROTEIN: uncharacterized protein LOC110990631 [Acanthaster planci]|uniref:LOW QUALITY PROTEIN: uncharacterized protein LOC110990631 n=1 Tax=Acanthaster planci TaxID=133434 RepID=A0A8B8A147_ACAPL|nr:LOW QUALITY PROTEIN: uncharacterized protein LOC110990631 [Acanthaster planci]
MNLYLSVLPLFKSFILIFEQKQPMCHRLHDEMVDLFKHFFSLKHSVRDEQKKTVREFRTLVGEAYISSAVYMQAKFPVHNLLLRYLSAIDPAVQGHSQTFPALKKIGELFTTGITDTEKDAYRHEVSAVQTNTSLPPTKVGEQSVHLHVYHWGTKVFKTQKYPTLSNVIKACLSIFTGPEYVERSFSTVNDLISSKANRLEVDTFSPMQYIKYELSSKHTTSLQLYHRKDVIKSPIDRSLIYHMQTANGRYKRRLEATRTEKEATSKRMKVDIVKHGNPSGRKTAIHKTAQDIKRRGTLGGKK